MFLYFSNEGTYLFNIVEVSKDLGKFCIIYSLFMAFREHIFPRFHSFSILYIFVALIIIQICIIHISLLKYNKVASYNLCNLYILYLLYFHEYE